MSFFTFLGMDGYGPYIWAAFGIAALVLITLLLEARRHWRRLAAIAAALEERRPARKRQMPASPS